MIYIDLQKKLDDAETKYIKQYNSFGATGYNQTYGGAAGITGYRMTDDQKKHISENSFKQATDGRYKVYVYNLNTKTYEEYLNRRILGEHYNIDVKILKYANIIIKKFLVIAKTKKELEEKLNKIKLNNNTSYRNQYTCNPVSIPDDFYEYYGNHTNKEICEKYNITSGTIYNWLKKLNVHASK